MKKFLAIIGIILLCVFGLWIDQVYTEWQIQKYENKNIATFSIPDCEKYAGETGGISIIIDGKDYGSWGCKQLKAALSFSPNVLCSFYNSS